MKNNLLLTTALVAASFAFTANAWADETGEKSKRLEKEGIISGETYEGYKTEGAIKTKGDLTVKDSEFLDNETKTDNGGAILSEASHKLTVENSTFSRNKAKSETTGKGFGGAILALGDAEITNSSFDGNEAESAGAIYGQKGLTVTSSTFSNNKVTSETKGFGGAIMAFGETHITNSSFEGNSANFGGAISGGENSDITVSGGYFKDNTATVAEGRADKDGGQGGAIRTDSKSKKLTISGTLFSGNTAETDGGAIWANGETTISGATFENNKTTSDTYNAEEGDGVPYSAGGGAIFVGAAAKTVTIDKGTVFKGNRSNTVGGAIATRLQNKNTDNTLKIDGARFEDNYAALTAGAINVGSTANVEISNAEFVGNSAGEKGGAININPTQGNSNGKLNITGNVVFENNTLSDGTKNDINFEKKGTINVGDKEGKNKASLTLDGGITGSEGTLTLGNGSSLTVKDTTLVESKVSNGDGEGNKAQVNIVLTDKTMNNGGFDLKDIFTANNGTIDAVKKDLKLESNNLYNIQENKGKDGTYTVRERSTSEIANRLSVKNVEAATLLATSSSKTGSGNKAFDDIQDKLRHEAEYGNNSALLSRAADAMVADAAPTVRVRETALSNMIFDTATDAMDDSLQNAAVGQSSGDNLFDKAKVWVKGLFNYADKDDTNKSHGFDIDTYGVAFGMDKNVSPSVKLGAGYAYSQSDIDGYTRDTDVDTHTLFAYAKYKPANWYVNTVASYSFSDYKEKKSVLSYGADAKYDVDTFGLQSVYGYELNTNGYDITPEAGLRYLHIAKDGYVDELGTMAVSKNTNVLTAIAGVKAAKTFELSNGLNIRPEVRAAVTYDLTSDNNDTNVVLPNGEALKVSGEKFDRFGAEFGAKLATDVTSNWEVAAGYEGRFRDDYQDHTGLISAKYKF